MHKLLFVTFLIALFGSFSMAQTQYDICYFGTAGIDFRSGNPFVLTNSQMNGDESAVSMVSLSGDLLFYSNGGINPGSPSNQGAVWNAHHEIMENGVLGDESGCMSSYDGAVAFPKLPNNPSSDYYIFMRDCVESSAFSSTYNSGLTYCEIDMNANNGLGKVVSKGNTVVPFDPGFGLSTSHEPLAAIANANEEGWYVFSYNLDSLYSVEVNNNGIGNYKSHIVGERRIIFSPSKEHVIVGNKLYFYDVVMNELSIVRTFPDVSYAFSPNGKFLYGIGGGQLHQYDLTAANVLATKDTIASVGLASQLFLAPDARIYLFQINGQSLLGVINCPNLASTNCDLSMNSIGLGGRKFGYVFTNMPANYLYYDGADCNLSVKKQKELTVNFEVYPNPSNGTVIIDVKQYKKPQPYKVVSYDGKVVSMGEINAAITELDLHYINAGVYYVSVNGYNKRVLINPE